MLEKLKEYRLLLTVIGMTVGFTLGFTTFFVTADEFKTYKDEQEYKAAKVERRELRQEVREYEQDLTDYGSLPPSSERDYQEALDDLEEVRDTIKAYKESKKEK